MKTIRRASYDEFVTWYLRREHTQRGRTVPDLGTMEQQKDSMAREHGGKIRGWFPSAEWRLIELDIDF